MNIASALEQYKKFPEIKKDDVDKILDWASKQPHLPKITELEAIVFLHSNYCKIEATKTTIDNYYTCRTHIPNFFNNRNLLGDDVALANETTLITALPQTTQKGHKVILSKLIDKDPTKWSLNGMLKLLTFVTDALLVDEGTAEGHIIVSDMEGVTLGHVARIGIMPIKHYLYYLQEALPFRLKGLHMINVSPVVDKIVFLMKPFMKKELWDVFHLHSTMDSVHKFIDAEVFPLDYEGGKAPCVKELHDSSFKHLLLYKEYFLEEEKTKRVNEKLRPGKPKNVGEIFGLEGNFKKLDID